MRNRITKSWTFVNYGVFVLQDQHTAVMTAKGHGSGEGHARGRYRNNTRCDPLYKEQRVRVLQDAGAVYNLYPLSL